MQSNLEKLDDAVLAHLAKTFGKPEYTEELIRRYMPLIRSQAARFETENISRDDLVSEGYLAAVKAVRSYDESRACGFGSYLSVCIANRLISVLRRAAKDTLSDEDALCGAEDNITPETIFLEKERITEIRRILSELEYSVFELYIEGSSYQSIAERLKISPKSADNAMQRAKKKLKCLYEN